MVSDNGSGMDEHTLASAFTPFFTTKSDGTGLELHTVKRMVEACDRSLRVSSKPGEGTSLVFDFKRATDEPQVGGTRPRRRMRCAT
jgi:signal transduction histidine kinase